MLGILKDRTFLLDEDEYAEMIRESSTLGSDSRETQQVVAYVMSNPEEGSRYLQKADGKYYIFIRRKYLETHPEEKDYLHELLIDLAVSETGVRMHIGLSGAGFDKLKLSPYRTAGQIIHDLENTRLANFIGDPQVRIKDVSMQIDGFKSFYIVNNRKYPPYVIQVALEASRRAIIATVVEANLYVNELGSDASGLSYVQRLIKGLGILEKKYLADNKKYLKEFLALQFLNAFLIPILSKNPEDIVPKLKRFLTLMCTNDIDSFFDKAKATFGEESVNKSTKAFQFLINLNYEMIEASEG
jgi:hypothetical protein